MRAAKPFRVDLFYAKQHAVRRKSDVDIRLAAQDDNPKRSNDRKGGDDNNDNSKCGTIPEVKRIMQSVG